MAETAYQTMYRQEFIAAYERSQSVLRSSVTTEANINGNTAVFLVADSSGDDAVTRGINGLIPYSASTLTQNSCTLAEWHAPYRRTSFNIYASQGDGRRIMQESSIAVLNRKIDDDIIAQLETGTQDTGAAATMSLDLVAYGIAILGNNDVPMSDITDLITPGAYAYLLNVKEFASSDYSKVTPFAGAQNTFFWAGINWIIHTGLSGKGTNAEKCILFHKKAIGHACDTTGIQTVVGYDEEHDYSFSRATGYMGSKLLQNSGVVILNHDGSGYSAQ
jgi:hypothetical protein